MVRGIVFLEEMTPIKIEVFDHRMKVITQNNFCFISSVPSFQEDKDPNHASKFSPRA